MTATTFRLLPGRERCSRATCSAGVSQRTAADLPPGDVLVRVALFVAELQGRSGRRRLIPASSASCRTCRASTPPASSPKARRRSSKPGDEVVITGYELGAGQWGGWAEYVRVPAEWVVPLPAGLSLKETMILGTAGFTAAQCVQAIQLNGVTPADGEIVVTGATGGVGCLAVKLLAKLGYTVVAVTGKPQLESQLKAWGASRIIGRAEVLNDNDRPLLGAAGPARSIRSAAIRWRRIVRETKTYGVVSACGLVGGTDLPLTVHPFILRGVTLAGIGSALLPYDRRLEIWRKLSDLWRLDGLDSLATTIGLDQLEQNIQRILAGQIVGRTVVALGAAAT